MISSASGEIFITHAVCSRGCLCNNILSWAHVVLAYEDIGEETAYIHQAKQSMHNAGCFLLKPSVSDLM